MATLGGISESKGAENSLEIESLAKFAVEDYDKKQVNRSKSFISKKWA